jgi:hypothetical protein
LLGEPGGKVCGDVAVNLQIEHDKARPVFFGHRQSLVALARSQYPQAAAFQGGLQNCAGLVRSVNYQDVTLRIHVFCPPWRWRETELPCPVKRKVGERENTGLLEECQSQMKPLMGRDASEEILHLI